MKAIRIFIGIVTTTLITSTTAFAMSQCMTQVLGCDALQNANPNYPGTTSCNLGTKITVNPKCRVWITCQSGPCPPTQKDALAFDFATYGYSVNCSGNSAGETAQWVVTTTGDYLCIGIGIGKQQLKN